MKPNNKESSSLDIVNQRMTAHNNHDLDTFLSLYSDQIQVYDYPTTPLGSPGKAHIKSIFEPLFKAKAVSTTIHHQIEQGKHVIIQETVMRQGERFNYVSVYEVADGLIVSVRFIRES